MKEGTFNGRDWRYLLFIFVLANFALTSNCVQTIVTVTTNRDLPQSQANCSKSSQCSLRGAWSLCQSMSTDCTISLPAHQTIAHNFSLGPLIQSSPTKITIDGNGATVVANRDNLSGWWWRRSSSNQLPAFVSLHSSKAVMASTGLFNFTVCPNEMVFLSTCHPESSGDTWMYIYDKNNKVVKNNDDFCGSLSRISFSSTSSSCERYSVEVKCYENSNCNVLLTADVWTVASYNEVADHYSFVQSYVNTVTSTLAPSVPSPLYSQFIISQFNSSTIGLTLQNLTISSFGSSSVNGGAIAILHSSVASTQSLTLKKTTFNDCLGKNGGAIAIMLLDNDNSDLEGDSFLDLEFDEVIMANNTAAFFGGNIYIKDYRSRMDVITVSLIGDNLLLINSSANNGGGVALRGVGWGSASLVFIMDGDGFKFSKTISRLSGGAFYAENINNYLYLASITVEKSIAVRFGGVIYLQLCSAVVIHNLDISSATAGSGGAIFGINVYDMQLKDLLIASSTGTYSTGVIRLESSSLIVITNSIFTDARGYRGGAISTVQSSGLIFSHLSLSGCSSTTVGGNFDFVSSSNIAVDNVQINGGTATHGGAFFFAACNGINLHNHHGIGLTAILFGGSYFFDNCHNVLVQDVALISSKVFVTGYDGVGGGGAFFVKNSSVVNIYNVQTNDSKARIGGSIDMYFCKNCHISNVTIKASIATTNGGGILVHDCSSLSINNTFMDTVSALRYGGGIDAYSCDGMILSQIGVQNGVATLGTGGIHIENSDNAVLTDIEVNDVTSKNRCGALTIDSCSYVTMSRINIAGSKAESGVGGGVCIFDSDYMNVVNVDVGSSQAESHGGGIYMTGCKEMNLRNVSVHDCISSGNGGGFYIDQRSDYLTLVNVDTIGNTAAIGGGGIFLSSLNKYVRWLDEASFKNQVVFTASKMTTRQSFEFPGATEIILYFIEDETQFSNKQSYCCASLRIQNDAGSGNELLYIDQNTEYLPGIDQAPMILRDISMLNITYINFHKYEENYVKMIIIPVYHDITLPIDYEFTGACITKGNKALTGDGGGVLMSYSNPGYVMLHHLITDNIASAGNGGGMLLRSTNSRGLISRSAIERNTAGTNGGGMFLGFSHYSLLMDKVEIKDNVASEGDGGGLYVFSNNGYGALDYGNHINCTYCIIENNRAEFGGRGGGVHFQQQNAIYFENSVVKGNTASIFSSSLNDSTTSGGSGGAISIGFLNDITLVDVEISENIAEMTSTGGCGGGIALTDSSNTILLDEVTVMTNKAHDGAGICVMGSNSITVQGNLDITNNQASDAGGAVLVSQSPLWSTLTASINIEGNIAVRGSALFLYSIPDRSKVATNYSLGTVHIAKNIATDGPTIFWVYDSSGGISSPPSDFADISNAVVSAIDGGALYGRALKSSSITVTSDNQAKAVIGTQPMNMTVPKAIAVNNYNSSVFPYVQIETSDYYYRLTGSSYVAYDITGSHCFSVKNPYLAASKVANHVLSQGKAELKDLRAYCYPEGNLTLRFAVPLSPLPTSISTKSLSYSLIRYSVLNFRACVAGEYISDGSCVVCPRGSYNLEPETDYSTSSSYKMSCLTCVGKTGVKDCYGSTLELEKGYWRRSAITHAVLPCLLDNSCPGGTGSGDSSCAEGYTGPLCAACSVGYHMVSGECIACGYQGVTETQLASLAIMALILLLLTGMWLYHHFLGHYWKRVQKRQRRRERRLKRLHAGRNNEGDSDNDSIEDEEIDSDSDEDSESEESDEVNQSGFKVFLNWLRTAFSDIMVKVKIVVATFQVVTSTGDVFDVAMPGSYTSFCRLFNFLNLNLSTLIPLNCLVSVNFARKLAWATGAPFVFLFFIFVAMCINYCVTVFLKRNTTMSSRRERRAFYKKLKYRFLNLVFYVTYLVLPSVTTMIFQLFICKNVDPDGEDGDPYDSYLVADVNIACSSEYYRRWLIYGYVMVLIYPIGIPTFYFICLYRNRNDIIERDSTGVEEANEDEDEEEADEEEDEDSGAIPDISKIRWGRSAATILSPGTKSISLSSVDKSNKSSRPNSLSKFSRQGSDANAKVDKKIKKEESTKNNLPPKRRLQRDNSKTKAAIRSYYESFYMPGGTANNMSGVPLYVSGSGSGSNYDMVPTAKSTEGMMTRAFSFALPPPSAPTGTQGMTLGVLNRAPRPMMLRRLPAMMGFKRKMSETAINMSFLWEAYKPEFWYWELVETTRRILLTAVLSICATGSVRQSAFGILLAYIFNKVYAYYQPYSVYSDFRLAEVGQTQIFLTYFATMLLTANVVDPDKEIVNQSIGVTLVLINVAIVVMGFYYELVRYFEDQEFHDKLKSIRRSMKSLLEKTLIADGASRDDKDGDGNDKGIELPQRGVDRGDSSSLASFGRWISGRSQSNSMKGDSIKKVDLELGGTNHDDLVKNGEYSSEPKFLGSKSRGTSSNSPTPSNKTPLQPSTRNVSFHFDNLEERKQDTTVPDDEEDNDDSDDSNSGGGHFRRGGVNAIRSESDDEVVPQSLPVIDEPLVDRREMMLGINGRQLSPHPTPSPSTNLSSANKSNSGRTIPPDSQPSPLSATNKSNSGLRRPTSRYLVPDLQLEHSTSLFDIAGVPSQPNPLAGKSISLPNRSLEPKHVPDSTIKRGSSFHDDDPRVGIPRAPLSNLPSHQSSKGSSHNALPGTTDTGELFILC